jgi:hypothetical protein
LRQAYNDAVLGLTAREVFEQLIAGSFNAGSDARDRIAAKARSQFT